MSSFMQLGIKDHPSISSEMVKFVCYAEPSNNTAELLARLGLVESLQRADQSNITKLETRFRKMEAWKGKADKTLKKVRTRPTYLTT